MKATDLLVGDSIYRPDCYDDHCYSYIIKHQYDKYHYKTYTDGEYLKFEETCEVAIKFCLKNLI